MNTTRQKLRNKRRRRVLGLYKSHVTEARQLMKNGRRFWIIGTIPGKEYKKAIKTVVEERKSI